MDLAEAAADLPEVGGVVELELKALERRLAGRGLANASGRSCFAQVGMLLNFALKKGWMKVDPRATYRKPREQLKDPNPLTDDELTKFFDFVRAPARFRPDAWTSMEWVGIGLLTLGLRPIELQRARWENVNWDERFLFIAESHGNKLTQARQWQPIPLAAWPHFLARRKPTGLIWTAHQGAEITDDALARMRRTVQAALPGFAWKRFRKSYATILSDAGNDVVAVSRLLRHSAGGKNVSIAQRHYVGRSGALLRDVVDEAFAPYAGMIGEAGKAVGTIVRASG